MALKEDNAQKELECYTKIINLFSKISKDPISIETCKDKTITKIMEKLKDPKNENWLRNALIILLSLFDDNPADLYSNLGVNTKKISSNERKNIFSELKKEFVLKQHKKKVNEILRKIKD